MSKAFIQPGATVWVIDYKGVRTGSGPVKLVVKSLIDDQHFKPVGARGSNHFRDTFETKDEATTAWVERAQATHAAELSRFNKISARLLSFERAGVAP